MNLKKPLNLAFIVRKYSTSGGTERYVYTITKKLAEFNHNITIYCAKNDVNPPHSNINIIKIPVLPGRLLKTYLFYQLTKSINISKYDIVQGNSKTIKHHIYRAGGGFHKLYLKYQKKRDKLTLYDKLIFKIENEIYTHENTKLIIAVSNFLKNEIIKEFKYPEERIVVLHNCVDTEYFKKIEVKRNNNNLKLLFVANDFKLKGLKNIIKAIKFLKNIKLFVVGNDRIKIEKNNDIIFLGEKRGDELIKIYNSCDILIHPTYYDPFSNVCLEAMACGVPVITTKINGASEIIDNYKDGIVISHSESIEELINAIKFFKNIDNLKQAKINAINKAKMYSIDNYVQKLLEIYKYVSEKRL